MVRVCMTCHSEDKARGISNPRTRTSSRATPSWSKGAKFWRVSTGTKSSNPVTLRSLPGFSGAPVHRRRHPGNGRAALTDESLLRRVPIEREYFDMFFFSALKSYKGAFHMSPDYAWWYGYADVLGHLAASGTRLNG